MSDFTNAINDVQMTGYQSNGCHGLINPIGFAFEDFDGLARPRSVEQSYSTTGMPLAQFPLLTASPMLSLGDWSGPVTDGTEVITGISQTTQLPACFLKQVHRFYTLTDEKPDDSCMLHDAYDKLVTTDGNASVLEAFRAQFISTFIFKRRLQ